MKEVKSGAAHLEYAQWLLEVTKAFGVEEIGHKVEWKNDSQFLLLLLSFQMSLKNSIPISMCYYRLLRLFYHLLSSPCFLLCTYCTGVDA